MKKKYGLLSTTECSTIQEALWNLVKQYPLEISDPNVVAQYDALGAKESLAVFVLGGRYKSKNVQGGFSAEVNFRVAYKSEPTSSELRLESQTFVGKIMKWLENTKDLPRLTDERAITKITASVVVPYKDETGTDKSTVYAADAVMEYESE